MAFQRLQRLNPEYAGNTNIIKKYQQAYYEYQQRGIAIKGYFKIQNTLFRLTEIDSNNTVDNNKLFILTAIGGLNPDDINPDILQEITDKTIVNRNKYGIQLNGYILCSASVKSIKEELTNKGFKELSYNGITLGDFIIWTSNEGDTYFGIVNDFRFAGKELNEIKIPNYSFYVNDLESEDFYRIDYVYKMQHDITYISSYQKSVELFKYNKIKQLLWEESINNNTTYPVVYKYKTCSFDGANRLIGEIDYSEIKGVPNSKNLFDVIDLTPCVISEFPFGLKRPSRKIKVTAGIELKLINNKKYPSLKTNKKYLIEDYLHSKKSSKPKVVIKENNISYIVPLCRFKVPLLKNNNNIK